MPDAGTERPGVQLSDAIEALSEGFALFDGQRALVLCNEAFRRLNPAIGMLIAPGVSFAMLLRAAAQREVIDAASADRLGWLEARLEPGDPPETLEVEGPGGRVSALTLHATRQGGLVMTHRDVSARRRLEAHEREADMLLRKVLEACPAHVIMSRVGDGQIMYRSPAATELLGTSRSAHEHFASREQRADFVTALLPNGRVDDMPLNCLRPDGRSFPASISARLIDYRGEEVVVASIVDLSREVAMRAELAAQRETIFQNEKMSALGELLAGVAHELNNPLSVVVGHALMLREEASDPEVARRTEKIGQAAERCARIVKSFLAMARQQPAALAPVDFDAVIRTGLDAVLNAPAGVGAEVEVALAGGLPQVMADADQLAQVVVNLVTNADQAIARSGRPGRIRVATGYHAGTRSVELTVADNGPGIPVAIRKRVFEPFFTTKEVNEGTGIGLALCHRVVASHGGRIRLEETPGGGATFVVRLPVAPAGRPAAVAPEATAGATARAPLLVVDDEPDVAELIREILTRQGFQVDHAPSGEAALAMIASRRYALVLSDLAMPGLGGRGLYAALLRDHPEVAGRVAFVTGDTMGPAARAFLAGTDRPRLEKPIAPDELRALVQRMLAEVT
jgi:signal transduction histidine kinase/ActR/RegA family two-component response regulator